MNIPLYLLRHGQSDSPRDRCIGQLDVSLTLEGYQQVQRLVDTWSGPIPNKIYCSDLCRASETARIIADVLGVPYCVDKRLRELFFGQWEGELWDEIYQKDPELMARWGSSWLDTSPPDGESAQQLFKRVSECAAEFEGDSLIVAHQGSLRALRCLFRGESPQLFFCHNFQHARLASAY